MFYGCAHVNPTFPGRDSLPFILIKHSLAHLQDIIPTLAGIIAYIFYTSQIDIESCRCARECFVCICICLS